MPRIKGTSHTSSGTPEPAKSAETNANRVEKPTVKVVYYGLLATLTGIREEEVGVDESTTVITLLQYLASAHGDNFRSRLVSKDDNLLNIARIWVDGVDVREAEGLDTRVGSGSKVSMVVLLQPISGG